MSEEGRKLKIAMFPWLAFGHMIPFLELAKLIAQRGHKIFFISTPRNIQRLPKIPPHLLPNITFVSFPLIHVDNLPPEAEATTDLSLHQVPYLKIAYDGLQSSLSEYLETSYPDWLIYDFAPYWLPPIAANLGISCTFFSIFPAWSATFFGSYKTMIGGDDRHEPITKLEQLTAPPKWVSFPTKVAFKIHEAKRLFKNAQVMKESGVRDLFRVSSVIKGCDVLALRSCAELESDYLTLLSELNNKLVVPVGLLPSSEVEDNGDDAWFTIRQFLDSQENGTTVYIAFGSELEMSQEDVSEFALGLELSSLPFIWALRTRQGSNSLELPQGFEERVKERGLVWTGWAPQRQIMAHESVGGFVTHCGYSSTVEAGYFGLPMIMMPFVADTGLIARVFEEKKVGVEVPRDVEDGSFTRESVAETVRLVVAEKDGEIYRENAKKMRNFYADKQLHDGYIHRFVQLLQNHKR